jgi:hypothetical protein
LPTAAAAAIAAAQYIHKHHASSTASFAALDGSICLWYVTTFSPKALAKDSEIARCCQTTVHFVSTALFQTPQAHSFYCFFVSSQFPADKAAL